MPNEMDRTEQALSPPYGSMLPHQHVHHAAFPVGWAKSLAEPLHGGHGAPAILPIVETPSRRALAHPTEICDRSITSSPRQRDVLRLEELHEPLVRAFAADAALLHAAERRRRVGHEAAVEPDHAEVELFRDAHAAAQVARVEVGDQAVFGIVGSLDHFVL